MYISTIEAFLCGLPAMCQVIEFIDLKADLDLNQQLQSQDKLTAELQVNFQSSRKEIKNCHRHRYDTFNSIKS